MSAPGNKRRTSTRDDWMTPWPVFRALDAEFGFTLDVCADHDNRRCKRWLEGPCNDSSTCGCGLCADWLDEVCWMNPPYSQAREWVNKAFDASVRGATVVGLLPNNTDTLWFEIAAASADELRFLTGRIQFEPRGASGNTGGSVFVIWRPKPHLRPWRGVFHLVRLNAGGNAS